MRYNTCKAFAIGRLVLYSKALYPATIYRERTDETNHPSTAKFFLPISFLFVHFLVAASRSQSSNNATSWIDRYLEYNCKKKSEITFMIRSILKIAKEK